MTWYRLDVRGDVMRAWLRAFGFVALAMVVLAVPLGFDEEASGLRVGAWIVGGASLVAGPTYLLLRLQRILGPDVYLAIHQEGIRWHDLEEDRFVAWSVVDDVRVADDGRGVVVAVEGGPPLRLTRPLLDVTPAELAARLRDLRTKALMGIRLRA